MGEIQPGAVRTAAGAIEDVAGAVRFNVPDKVGEVAGALTDSASGAAGTALATAWTDAFRGWATSAEAHAQSMRDAATTWERTNDGAANRFHRLEKAAY